MRITVPDIAPDSIVTVIALQFDGSLKTDTTRLLASNVAENILHVFDGKLFGKGIRFGNGNARLNCVHNWSEMESGVSWKLRANQDTKFALQIVYDATKGTENNRYQLSMGDQSFELDVIPGNNFTPISLGEISLKKGETEFTVKPLILEGDELMKLRSIILTPIK